MRIKDREANKREVAQAIRQGWHNSLKCSHSPAEGRAHRNVKYMLMDFCLENGLDFHTEAIFRNEERADFIISDWKLIIEVLNTEDEKRFKSKTYPFPVLPVSAKADMVEITQMLNDLQTCNGTNAEYYARRYFGEK